MNGYRPCRPTHPWRVIGPGKGAPAWFALHLYFTSPICDARLARHAENAGCTDFLDTAGCWADAFLRRAAETTLPPGEEVSGTFCRNGPSGASHKRCLAPFPRSFTSETAGRQGCLEVVTRIGGAATRPTWHRRSLHTRNTEHETSALGIRGSCCDGWLQRMCLHARNRRGWAASWQLPPRARNVRHGP